MATGFGRFASFFQYRLALLNNFVGEAMPDEVINGVGGEVEAEFFYVFRNCFCNCKRLLNKLLVLGIQRSDLGFP